MRQRLQQLEFYRRRVEELGGENAHLMEDRQRLEALLSTRRKNEEDAIEDSVQTQLLFDQIQGKLQLFS